MNTQESEQSDGSQQQLFQLERALEPRGEKSPVVSEVFEEQLKNVCERIQCLQHLLGSLIVPRDGSESSLCKCKGLHW